MPMVDAQKMNQTPYFTSTCISGSWSNFSVFVRQQRSTTSTVAATCIFLAAIPIIVDASVTGRNLGFGCFFGIRIPSWSVILLLSLLASTIRTLACRDSVCSTKRPLFRCATKVTDCAPPVAEIAQCTDEREQFMAMFPILKQELLASLRQSAELHDEVSLAWIDRMIDYSVPGGKLNRGLTVIMVFRSLLRVNKLTPDQMERASILGWVIEFLQASSLVADDIMDQSHTRRGRPCWYRRDGVGMKAINDSFLLKSFAFQLVRRHFYGELRSCLLDLLLDVVHKTEIGQLYDLQSSCIRTYDSDGDQNQSNAFDRFTMERYRLIVKYKTCFYSFYLPVAMGFRLAGITDAAVYVAAKEACFLLGEYYQVQDDFLDCFGDPSVTGKVGSDIRDGKCTWLVVQALHKCSASQRRVLEENYGSSKEGSEVEVQRLYQELGLIQEFKAYESKVLDAIRSKLDTSSKFLPWDLFEQLWLKIHQRPK